MRRNINNDNLISGHPLTVQRRLLLDLLRESEGHVDAKELYHRASLRDKSISPATVYRSLNLFKELGLIDEMRLDKVRCYYEIKQSPGHQHMICQGCGKVIEFEDPYFQDLMKMVQHDYGFNITKATLYLEGFCPDCDENTLKKEASVQI